MAFMDGSQAYNLERDVYRRTRTQPRMRAKARTKANSTRRMTEMAIIAITILALGVLYVAQHATMALVGDRLFQEQKALDSLKAENGHLRLELMRLSSLSRVEHLARGSGKMVEPGQARFLALIVAPVSRETSGAAAPSQEAETVSLSVQRLAKPAHVAMN